MERPTSLRDPSVLTRYEQLRIKVGRTTKASSSIAAFTALPIEEKRKRIFDSVNRENEKRRNTNGKLIENPELKANEVIAKFESRIDLTINNLQAKEAELNAKLASVAQAINRDQRSSNLETVVGLLASGGFPEAAIAAQREVEGFPIVDENRPDETTEERTKRVFEYRNEYIRQRDIRGYRVPYTETSRTRRSGSQEFAIFNFGDDTSVEIDSNSATCHVFRYLLEQGRRTSILSINDYLKEINMPLEGNYTVSNVVNRLNILLSNQTNGQISIRTPEGFVGEYVLRKKITKKLPKENLPEETFLTATRFQYDLGSINISQEVIFGHPTTVFDFGSGKRLTIRGERTDITPVLRYLLSIYPRKFTHSDIINFRRANPEVVVASSARPVELILRLNNSFERSNITDIISITGQGRGLEAEYELNLNFPQQEDNLNQKLTEVSSAGASVNLSDRPTRQLSEQSIAEDTLTVTPVSDLARGESPSALSELERFKKLGYRNVQISYETFKNDTITVFTFDDELNMRISGVPAMILECLLSEQYRYEGVNVDQLYDWILEFKTNGEEFEERDKFIRTLNQKLSSLRQTIARESEGKEKTVKIEPPDRRSKENYNMPIRCRVDVNDLPPRKTYYSKRKPLQKPLDIGSPIPPGWQGDITLEVRRVLAQRDGPIHKVAVDLLDQGFVTVSGKDGVRRQRGNYSIDIINLIRTTASQLLSRR